MGDAGHEGPDRGDRGLRIPHLWNRRIPRRRQPTFDRAERAVDFRMKSLQGSTNGQKTAAKPHATSPDERRSTHMTGKGVPQKALIWGSIAGFGALAGLLLGQFVVGSEVGGSDADASYADLAGNTDALSVDEAPAAPCYGCPDRYSAAMRARAAREARMDDSFRELGVVTDEDTPLRDGDYILDGLQGEAVAMPDIVMQLPVPVETGEPAQTPSTPAPPVVPTLPSPPTDRANGGDDAAQ